MSFFKKKQITDVFLTLIIILAILFILNEVVDKVHLNSDEFGKFDYDLGIAGLPNQSGYYKNNDGSLVKININSDGFRDYEFSKTKDPNTYRILVFGDSYVASFQNSQNETSTKVLEQILNQNSSKKIEVYNLGIAGYSPSTYYILLNKTIDKYKPDLVIFSLVTSSDVTQSNYKINGVYYPYFTVENDKLISHPFKKATLYTLNEKTGFIFKSLQRTIYFRLIEFQENAKAKLNPRTDYVNIYLINKSPEYDEAWDIVGHILRDSDALCKLKNCTLVSLTFTNKEQMTDNYEKEFLKNYKDYSEVSESNLDFKMPEKDFLSQCSKYNLTCFSTINEIRQRITSSNEQLTFSSDPHYNKYGNRVHAEIIASKIRDLIR